MNNTDILALCEELEQQMGKTVSAPWHTHSGNYIEKDNWLFAKAFDGGGYQRDHDIAQFICSARNTLPTLIAAIREMARRDEEHQQGADDVAQTIWSLMRVPCRQRSDRMCMALSHPVGCDYRCCPALETWRIAGAISEGGPR